MSKRNIIINMLLSAIIMWLFALYVTNPAFASVRYDFHKVNDGTQNFSLVTSTDDGYPISWQDNGGNLLCYDDTAEIYAYNGNIYIEGSMSSCYHSVNGELQIFSLSDEYAMYGLERIEVNGTYYYRCNENCHFEIHNMGESNLGPNGVDIKWIQDDTPGSQRVCYIPRDDMSLPCMAGSDWTADTFFTLPEYAGNVFWYTASNSATGDSIELGLADRFSRPIVSGSVSYEGIRLFVANSEGLIVSWMPTITTTTVSDSQLIVTFPELYCSGGIAISGDYAMLGLTQVDGGYTTATGYHFVFDGSEYTIPDVATWSGYYQMPTPLGNYQIDNGSSPFSWGSSSDSLSGISMSESFPNATSSTIGESSEFSTTVTFEPAPTALCCGQGVYVPDANTISSSDFTFAELSVCPAAATKELSAPDASLFGDPGIYKYVVSRTSTANAAEWQYSTEKYLLDVVVTRNASTNALEISQMTAHELTEDNGTYTVGAKVDTMSWSHNFVKERTLSVSKQVEGEYGRQTNPFEFTVLLSLPEWYSSDSIAYSGTKDNGQVIAGDSSVAIVDDAGSKSASLTISLAHDDEVTFSVPVGTTYTISETTAQGSGKVEDDTGLQYDTNIEYGPVSTSGEEAPAGSDVQAFFYSSRSFEDEPYAVHSPDNSGYTIVPETPEGCLPYWSDSLNSSMACHVYPGETIKVSETLRFYPAMAAADEEDITWSTQTIDFYDQYGNISSHLEADGDGLYLIPDYLPFNTGEKFIGWAVSDQALISDENYAIYYPGERRAVSEMMNNWHQLANGSPSLHPIVVSDEARVEVFAGSTHITSVAIGDTYTLPDEDNGAPVQTWRLTQTYWGHPVDSASCQYTGWGLMKPGDTVKIMTSNNISIDFTFASDL